MNKVIHLISDLHLCESQPHLTKLLEHYLQEIAPSSQQLFVLGDLFEMWVGDDLNSEFNRSIIDLLATYSRKHGELLIAHGNRDFLIGEKFVNQIGATLIKEPYQCEWDGKPICLMHGDSLCTDDIPYQEFRTMVRSPQWQQQFLSQPLENRLAYAANVRAQSQSQQMAKPSEIMDVNQDTVIKTIIDNQCEWLIHGHTHRQAQHQVSLPHSKTAKRIVLSDWGKQGHYLAYQQGDISSHYFSVPGASL